MKKSLNVNKVISKSNPTNQAKITKELKISYCKYVVKTFFHKELNSKLRKKTNVQRLPEQIVGLAGEKRI